MSSTTTTSTSSAISLFADLALKAKADLMDFGVRARSQLADLSRETGITAPDRATTLRGAELFFAGFGALSIATYLIPLTYQKLFHRPQNLVKKYNAKWALVTGGSSGIVRQLCSPSACSLTNCRHFECFVGFVDCRKVSGRLRDNDIK